MVLQPQSIDPRTPTLEARRRALASILARFAGSDGVHGTAIPALSIYRSSAPNAPSCGMYTPALTVIAQGAKRVMLAGVAYAYDQAHYLLTSVDLPVSSQVVQASAASPCLSFILALDLGRVGELMSEAPPRQPATGGRALSVSPLSVPLLDAVLRMAQLLDSPGDVPVLAPLVEREILYRLLTGEQGARLRHMAASGSQAQQVAKAVSWIRKNYMRPLRIERLAETAGMSPSSLHHHFKSITTMSPLQYQKQLRLHEARRLMLAERLDAGTAAHRVGYESPSQFSREYNRLYGAPPVRDVAKLRGMGLETENAAG